jgi:hypothetical protein
MSTYTDRLRDCAMCGSEFESFYGAEICSRECRAARQAKYTREYQARRKAEHDRLKSIVEQLQVVVAA